ncbi:MAG TPA: TlpA disulfide reductase family protein [Bacteroidota bacterium]|jgi:thiol-disulfide isomerase/thioredoxin|nr:TlpA disulfide reductase family protein [Bacteroidota bacterium]
MVETRKFRWTQLVGFIIIAGLTVEVVFLSIQNRQLKNVLKSRTMISQVESLKAGEKVEPLKIQTLEGETTVLSYNDPAKKYLLCVFSTTCPHCEKILPAWQTLAEKNNDNCFVIGISIHNVDETRKYVTAKKVGFYSVSASSDTSFNRKYKISGVPETILLDGNGKVQKAWVGELTSEQTIEIQALLSASQTLAN